MSKVQITVLGILSSITMCVMIALFGSFVFLVLRDPALPSPTVPALAPGDPAEEPTLTSTFTPFPPVELPEVREPTPTSTQVVANTATVTMTPSGTFTPPPTPTGTFTPLPTVTQRPTATPTFEFVMPTFDDDDGAGSSGSSGCCKHCSTGKACGDSCIARDKTCHKPPGCAC